MFCIILVLPFGSCFCVTCLFKDSTVSVLPVFERFSFWAFIFIFFFFPVLKKLKKMYLVFIFIFLQFKCCSWKPPMWIVLFPSYLLLLHLHAFISHLSFYPVSLFILLNLYFTHVFINSWNSFGLMLF